MIGRDRAPTWLRFLRSLRPHAQSSAYEIPPPLAGWFDVVEIDDVEADAGDLFRRSFRAEPPRTPRHYIARADTGSETRTLGYVHYEGLDDMYLCGGMCMDERVFRRLSAERRAALRTAGGVAEQMLRCTFAKLAHAKAIFGYVGDKRAERVDLRVGFRHTGLPHLIVHWPRRLPAAEQRARVERVAKLGPF